MCKKASGLKSGHDFPFSWSFRFTDSALQTVSIDDAKNTIYTPARPRDAGIEEHGAYGEYKPMKERPLEPPMKYESEFSTPSSRGEA